MTVRVMVKVNCYFLPSFSYNPLVDDVLWSCHRHLSLHSPAILVHSWATQHHTPVTEEQEEGEEKKKEEKSIYMI